MLIVRTALLDGPVLIVRTALLDGPVLIVRTALLECFKIRISTLGYRLGSFFSLSLLGFSLVEKL